MQESFDNPYRAPRANVDEFEPIEEDRGPRPPQVAVAVVMLWVVLIMQVAGLVYNWQFFRLQPAPCSSVALVMSGTLGVERVAGGNDRTWPQLGAHHLSRAVPAVSAALCIHCLSRDLCANTAGALPTIAQALLQSIALFLLFVGPARHWYRTRPR